MAKVRELTAKPFGVDLLTAMPGQVEQGIDDVIKGGARIFVAGLGVPREAVDALHDANVLVGSMCGKVRHAVNAVASGCDFVVAQGTEAGGHTGTVATMALVPQVVDAVGEQVPVVAAGGLFDGRGLAAALTLGADGVWIGTRFIATPEARSVDGYKETLLATPEDGTVISRAFTGKTCRVVRNDWTQHFEEHPEELQPFPAQVFAADRGRRQPPRRPRRHGRRRAPRVLPRRPGRRRHRRARAGRRARPPHDERGRTGAVAEPRDTEAVTLAAHIDDVLGERHPAGALGLHRDPQRLGGLRPRVGGERLHGRRRRR